MPEKKKDKQSCMCCQAPAIFEVDSSPACRRHLATIVESESGWGGESVHVTVINEEN